MHKILRFTKLLFRAISKPASKTIYRIPQIVQVVGDDHKHEFNFHTSSKSYLQAISHQHQQIFNLRTTQGLSELVKVNNLQLQRINEIKYAGDYAPYGNPEQFVHAIQFHRKGAQTYFYSIDELETVQSEYIPEPDIEFQDSQIIQQP